MLVIYAINIYNEIEKILAFILFIRFILFFYMNISKHDIKMSFKVRSILYFICNISFIVNLGILTVTVNIKTVPDKRVFDRHSKI